MAKLVRMCIKLFIDMIKKYGFKKALKKLTNKSKILKRINNQINKRKELIQLLIFLGINCNKNLKIEEILTKLLL